MLVGSSCLGQPDSTSIDSTKTYLVHGYMLRNSYIRMLRADQLKLQLKACEELTVSLSNQLDDSFSLNALQEKEILALRVLNSNCQEQHTLKDADLKQERKATRKRNIRTGVFVGVLAFALGLAASALL